MSVYYWDHARAQHFTFSVCFGFDYKGLVQNVSHGMQTVENFWATSQHFNFHASVRCMQWEEPEGSLLKVTKHRACRQSAIPDPTREEGLIW